MSATVARKDKRRSSIRAPPQEEPEEEGFDLARTLSDILAPQPQERTLTQTEVDEILAKRAQENSARIRKIEDKLSELQTELEQADGANAQKCVDLLTSAHLYCKVASDNNAKHSMLTATLLDSKMKIPALGLDQRSKSVSEPSPKKKPEVDNDMIERLTVMGVAAGELYKIAFGALLIVFVPHVVDGDEDYSIESALKQKTPLGMAALCLNIVCLVFLLLLYLVELMRENWCIANLDIDSSQPDNNVENLPKEVTKDLVKWNGRYWFVTKLCIFVCGMNVILSGAYLGKHYESPITVTTALNLFVMLATKLNKVVSAQSKPGLNSRSAYMIEFTSFNVLDKDIRDQYPSMDDSMMDDSMIGHDHED